MDSHTPTDPHDEHKTRASTMDPNTPTDPHDELPMDLNIHRDPHNKRPRTPPDSAKEEEEEEDVRPTILPDPTRPTIMNQTKILPPPDTMERTKDALHMALLAPQVVVNLTRPKDAQSPARTQRADKVAVALQERLSALFPNPSGTIKEPLLLTAQVILASEGSRFGRIMAAELGYGLAKMGVVWKLSDTSGETTYMSSYLHKTSTAGCGAADICQSDAGERALDKMTDQIALEIQRYIYRAWHLK